MSASSITKRTLMLEIVRIDQKASHITNLKEEAIQALNMEKESMLQRGAEQQEAAQIKAQIEDIEQMDTDVMGVYTEKLAVIHAEREQMEELELSILQIEKELILIEERHGMAMRQLEGKKNFLRERLTSIDKLDSIVQNLEQTLMEIHNTYATLIDEVRKKRAELLSSTGAEQDEIQQAVVELSEELDELEKRRDREASQIEEQIVSLKSEMNISSDVLAAKKEELERNFKRLEMAKKGASAQELEEINKMIKDSQAQVEECEKLMELVELSSREHLIKLLEGRDLSLTPSGHFRTASGRLLTYEEAKMQNLLNGLDDELLRLFGYVFTPSGHVLTAGGDLYCKSEAERLGLLKDLEDKYAEPSESSRMTTTSTATSMSGLSSSDVHYLKTTLGKPLTLALAEITAKQPRDPIHYLGHWLFQYRYKQEADEKKRAELQELMEERERIATARMRDQAEKEATATLLDLLGRVEHQAEQHKIQAELARIERELIMQEEEEEQLEKEALDTLGEYKGPTTGQKLN